MAEPPYRQRDEDRFTLWQFLRRLPESNFTKFALFVPYWRRDLRFGYWEVMGLVTAALVIQVPALVLWGRASDRYGNKKVLAVTSLGIAALPAMWLFWRHIAFAVFMQFWSGFWWSGFSQSVSNFLLDAVSPPKRARCTAYLNLVANAGILLGGLAGSLAIGLVPARIGPVEFPFAFHTLLVLSTALRASVIFIFLPLVREVRDVPRVSTVEMLFHATREAADAAVNLMTGLARRESGNAGPRDGSGRNKAGGPVELGDAPG